MKARFVLFGLLAGLLMACASQPIPTATPLPTATASPTPAPTEVSQVTYDPAFVQEGQINYGIFCAPCHAPDARGVAGVGYNLRQSDLLHNNTDADVLTFVVLGRTADDPANITGMAMPARGGYPNLQDEQILSIIAYLRSLPRE